MPWLFSAFEELLPVAAFFAVQQLYTFAAGLVVMTMIVVGLLALSHKLGRRAPRFALASTAGLLAFSVPSIVTGDSRYFQVSDTILNGAFAALLLASWWFRFLLLKHLFDRVFAIKDEAWQTLSLRWGLLFLSLAAMNEYVRLGFSEDVWAAYKLISTMVILLFGCYQFTLSARMRLPGESNWLGLRDDSSTH